MGKMIDVVFEGTGFAKMVYIVSKDYQKISNKIQKRNKKEEQQAYMLEVCIKMKN